MYNTLKESKLVLESKQLVVTDNVNKDDLPEKEIVSSWIGNLQTSQAAHKNTVPHPNIHAYKTIQDRQTMQTLQA